MRLKQLIPALLTPFLFSACVPQIDKESALDGAAINKELKSLDADDNRSLDAQWWKAYGDGQLDEMIGKALGSSPTIKSIEARYAQANSIIASAQAGNMPSVFISGAISRQRFSENYIFPPPLGGAAESLYQAGAGLEYDFDFFNARGSKILSAKYSAMAQKAYINEMKLALSSALCKLYLSWGYDERRVQMLLRFKDAMMQEQSILKRRYAQGVIDARELNSNLSDISKIDQEIDGLKRVMQSKKESIGVLGGFMPSYLENLHRPSIKEGVNVPMPKEIYLDLIAHRADVAVQKYTVLSKEANIENAKAQFYPNISLSALVGFTSFDLAKFADNSSYAPIAGLALSLPIFDGGARKANLNIKVSDYNSSVNDYNNVIIKAVNEVVGVVKKTKILESQICFLQKELDAKNLNEDIAKQRFDAGLSDKLPYITAKLESYKSELVGIDLDEEKSLLRIELIKALGGGYKEKEDKTDAND